MAILNITGTTKPQTNNGATILILIDALVFNTALLKHKYKFHASLLFLALNCDWDWQKTSCS
jgi:hypothetical protein